MQIENLSNDKAVLDELGRRLGQRRVGRNLTQAALAKEAGVSKRTVERVEAGESTQVSTLIRILRALGLLDSFDGAIPEPAPHPIDLLKLRGKERKRASAKRRKDPAEAEWSWGEDT